MGRVDLNSWINHQFDELVKCDLQPVSVAVLDSGIDASHPDLLGRVIKTFAVHTFLGRARVEERSISNVDVVGHGTAVASVIARLAPNTQLIDIRVLGTDLAGSSTALIAGLEHAVELKARIINMSLAATAEFAPKLWPLCEKAYRQNQLVVAAKRNMPLADLGFPAEFSSCISVDRERFETPYRLRFRPNDIIEYAASGDDVVVAAPGGGYTRKTGTSFATPTISALCALLLGVHPELRTFEVKTILKALSD
jgi:subtilisin family serine protease